MHLQASTAEAGCLIIAAALEADCWTHWLQISVHKAQAVQVCTCQDNLSSVQAGEGLMKNALRSSAVSGRHRTGARDLRPLRFCTASYQRRHAGAATLCRTPTRGSEKTDLSVQLEKQVSSIDEV